MDFDLFSDIDENFSISLMENGEQIKLIEVHPETGGKMDRQAALKLAEELCNKKMPESKEELFNLMSEEDFDKFVMARAEVEELVRSSGLVNVEEDFRNFHGLILKLDLVSDFIFSKREIDVLKKFCKVFNLSVVPDYE